MRPSQDSRPHTAIEEITITLSRDTNFASRALRGKLDSCCNLSLNLLVHFVILKVMRTCQIGFEDLVKVIIHAVFVWGRPRRSWSRKPRTWQTQKSKISSLPPISPETGKEQYKIQLKNMQKHLVAGPEGNFSGSTLYFFFITWSSAQMRIFMT